MATMSGGNAALQATTQPLGALSTRALSSVSATPDEIAQSLYSSGARAQFIDHLQRSGLLGADGTVGFTYIDAPGSATAVDQARTPVVIENTGATTFTSTAPILVSLGDNASATLGSVRGPGIKAQNDTVIGGSGENYIVGNDARSLLVAGSGRETIQSGHGRDTIQGGAGYNMLIGGGRSQIQAGSGRTSVIAGSNDKARDTVNAGAGRDTISLSSGKNTVVLGSGLATVTAGSGSDLVMGGSGAATVNSGAHTTLSLGKGAVTLNAPANAAVNDTVYGGANTGALKLNVASTAATVTRIDADHSLITFGSSTIETVDGVKVVFNDHTHRTV